MFAKLSSASQRDAAITGTSMSKIKSRSRRKRKN